MSLVTIETFGDTSLARLARSRLEAAGIPCNLGRLESMSLGFLGPVIGGVELQVAERDVERAKAILDRGVLDD